MGKRAGEPIEDESDALKSGRRPQKQGGDEAEAVEFEDEYDDEYESEDELVEAGTEGRDEGEQEDAMQVDKQTFIPGRHKLAPGETLSPDLSSYEMLHTLTTTWPCLSFDIIRDNLGDGRKSYPATVYAVAGTQAQSGREKENELMVMKLSGLSRMHREDEESSDVEDDDDDEEDAEPILETKSLPLSSTTNRIRAHQSPPWDSSVPPTTLVATMAETGQVLIHDVTPHLTSFDTPGTTISAQQNRPLSTLRMHKSTEGYAVDWSPLIPQGKLLTGDNDGKIFVTTRTDGGAWVTDTRPFTGHEGSVEEIQWSPTERNVFGSASSDGTVKIWDLRSKSHRPAVSVSVSNTDVNVMSWSHQTAHLLATGAEDGAWAVWDLRQWKPAPPGSSASSDPSKSAVARFSFHKEQITSIEWHPQEDSIVAVAAGDNTLSLWDLAVELDDDESRNTEDVPPQLLFLHYAEMIKECHWHPQIPGCIMVTGGAGFGVLKTISV